MNCISITSPDINNGLGCRVTLWVAGCSHRCPGCHNKETWNYNQGTNILDKTIIDKIDNELSKPYIKGITISGGDPLSQYDSSLIDLCILLRDIKAKYPDKDIWIYAGDTFEDILENELKTKVISYCDVLVDGTYKEKLRDISLPFRGSKNQRIIDIKKSMHKRKAITFIK